MNFFPELDGTILAGIRMSYGVILLLTLLQAIPQWWRFFLSEKWGGYEQSSWLIDLVGNPFVFPLLGAVWLLCPFCLLLNQWVLPAALFNVALSYYFFVWMRWRSCLRGMGAPGLISFWLGVAILALEYTYRYAPSLTSLTILVFQVDLALIVFSAGFYKFRSGYLKGHGIDYGMVNPMWGYWSSFFKKFRPSSLLFLVLNQMSWSSQILCALLMLLPPTRFLGGVLEIGTYLFIMTQIRLGFLAEMMCIAGLLFITKDSFLAEMLAGILPSWPLPQELPHSPWIEGLNQGLGVFLWFHLLAILFCHTGLFYNFYGRKKIPGIGQSILDFYTNLFGIIIWRVFSVDHLNFFIRISKKQIASESRILLSEYKNPKNLRFWHVGEMIAITSLFTTRKYYPSNKSLFQSRLLRYSRTLPCTKEERLIFEYYSIRKKENEFAYELVAEYEIDPQTGSLQENILEKDFSPSAVPEKISAVHEGVKPGSYV